MTVSQLPPAHPYLLQMRFRAIGRPRHACQTQGQDHRGRSASWEVHLYSDPGRLRYLLEQGVPQAEIEQVIWEEMGQEQDTRGPYVYQTLLICAACATEIIGQHGGLLAAVLAMSTAAVTQGIILLVSDRATEKGIVVGNVPGHLQDHELLPWLEQTPKIDLQQSGE